jgi:hypothetical protein
MGFAMCVVNLGIVAAITSATRRKLNEQGCDVRSYS